VIDCVISVLLCDGCSCASQEQENFHARRVGGDIDALDLVHMNVDRTREKVCRLFF